jgi:hypothetical protein
MKLGYGMGQVGRTFLGYPSPPSHGGAIFWVPSSFQSGKIFGSMQAHYH